LDQWLSLKSGAFQKLGKIESRPMKSKRRRHDPAFKARVAIEALSGAKTLAQIAKEYDLHPMQVSEWKKALQEHSSELFASGSRRRNSVEAEEERTRQELHAKIGEQAVVIDWLKKKCRQLGVSPT
jgi:transposase-like protein